MAPVGSRSRFRPIRPGVHAQTSGSNQKAGSFSPSVLILSCSVAVIASPACACSCLRARLSRQDALEQWVSHGTRLRCLLRQQQQLLQHQRQEESRRTIRADMLLLHLLL